MEKASRSKTQIRNSAFGIILFLVNLVTTFVERTVFVRVLGHEISGLAGVLGSVISSLSIVDLGIGTAIGFSLYKPLAENDERKLAVLIRMFRKIYMAIGFIIAALGLAVMPFLPALTGGAFTMAEIMPIYLLLLAHTIISYFFTYNFTILRADQKSYIISIVDSIFKLLVMSTQIIILLTVENYIPYLIASLIGTLIMDIVLFLYVKKKYPYLSGAKNERLEKEEIKTIKTKISSMIFHRVGRFLISSADNLIISAVLVSGVLLVGYYKSYLLLTTVIISLTVNLFSGIGAAFGNIIATENREHVKKTFGNIRFLYFVIYTIAVVGVFVMSTTFLTLWLGSETVLSLDFLIVFCVNLYLTGYGETLVTLRNAAGVYEPDRFLPIALVLLKVGVSVLLAHFLGITGVLLGTTVILIIRESIALPHIAQKYIYGGTKRGFYLRFALDFFVMLVCAAASWGIVQALSLPITAGGFILGGFICVFVTAAILLAVYARTAEMKYLLSFFKRLLKRKNKE